MRFVVSGVAYTSVFHEVEAETEEEAMKKAELLGTPRLCHHCSSAKGADTWCLSDGLGETVVITEVEPA